MNDKYINSMGGHADKEIDATGSVRASVSILSKISSRILTYRGFIKNGSYWRNRSGNTNNRKLKIIERLKKEY